MVDIGKRWKNCKIIISNIRLQKLNIIYFYEIYFFQYTSILNNLDTKFAEKAKFQMKIFYAFSFWFRSNVEYFEWPYIAWLLYMNGFFIENNISIVNFIGILANFLTTQICSF